MSKTTEEEVQLEQEYTWRTFVRHRLTDLIIVSSIFYGVKILNIVLQVTSNKQRKVRWYKYGR